MLRMVDSLKWLMTRSLLLLSIVLWGISAAYAQTIRWVMEEVPPFSHLERERVTGFFPDMALAVCQEIKTRCEFSVLPFSKAMNALQNGKADGMLGATYSQKRADWLRYDAPIAKTTYGLFARASKKTPVIKQFIDLEGLHWDVGTQGPSDTYNELKLLEQQVSDLSITSYPTMMEAIFAVHNGEVNAVYGSLDVIRGLEKIAHVPPLYDMGFHQPMLYYYAWNIKTVSPQLAIAFNQAYQKLLSSGRIAEIASHYHVSLAH